MTPPARRRQPLRAAGTSSRNRRHPDAAASVEALVAARDRLRRSGRKALGIDADQEAPPPISSTPPGTYPLVAMGLLALATEMPLYALGVLGPQMGRALGFQPVAVVGVVGVVASLTALAVAWGYQRWEDRARFALVAAAVWSVAVLGVGLTAGRGQYLGLALVIGLAMGSVHALHPPLIVDSYPPAARVRALAGYRAGADGGMLAAALLVLLAAEVFGLTWRAILVAVGLLGLGAVAAASRLREPGFGVWDVGRVQDVVRENERAPARDQVAVEPIGVPFGEIVRRLTATRTLASVFAGWAMLGALLTPLFGFVSFFLEDRWSMGLAGRGLVWATVAGVSVAALVVFAPHGEQAFGQGPPALLRLGSLLLAAGVVAVALAAFVPTLAVMVLLLAAGMALIGLVHPVLNVAMLTIVQPRMRPHASALAGVFLTVVGAVGGALLLGGLDRRFGIGVAIATLAIPGLAVSLLLRRAAGTIVDDLDGLLDEVIGQEELAVRSERGEHLPLLSCRHVDFSYGQVQVLFDVSFTVDDGEMVALLGTNGAGKSTLLKVISGIGLSSRGSVVYRGDDITYLDPGARVSRGVSQIPGGRAVFGPMTVAENLRVYGYSARRDPATVERGIDATFDAFPALADRRSQLASTLSGGEQQMLALGTAFILRPRLLLIDELSLGLAPKIVGELLEAVRRINAEGTAVVLVEQSVNIALTLVEHAYFMEKGEIRFDGRSADLLARPDLLRSVFLEGAKSGLGRPGAGG